MRRALREHWPEYLMEGAELATFMIAACLVVTLLEHPASPLRQALPATLVRRALTGAAMGLTAIALVYSPWGKRSGAHFNPSVTFTFWRLGKVAGWDAVFYAAAQVTGAVLGVALVAALVGRVAGHPAVHYAATRPGVAGVAVAFVAEVAISFGLMLTVLTVSNVPRLARFTGLLAGTLVATYITVEAPLSGMSMNPARTLGSAVSAREWQALWVYFTAPLAGMLFAAETYVRLRGRRAVRCAKLHHDNPTRCIFCLHQLRRAAA